MNKLLHALALISFLILPLSTQAAFGTFPQNPYLQTNPVVLPILMYHHIRDYSNPSDPLGVNLSVSPQNFAAQLDEIEKLGYHTITFKDIATNRIPAKPIMLTFDDGYNDFYQYAYPELKKRNMKAVAYIIVNALNTPGYLSSQDVKELSSDNNIEIGSHTMNHPALAELELIKQRYEIQISKARLEKLIQKPVVSFCYPSGSYDDQTVEEVEKADYKYAVTTRTGTASTDYKFTLFRLRITPSTSIQKLLSKRWYSKHIAIK